MTVLIIKLTTALGIKATVSQYLFITAVYPGFQSARLSVHCPVVRTGSPHSLTRKRVLLPLPFRSKGGDTLACGGSGRGTQFHRKDRHSGTLCVYNPSTVEGINSLTLPHSCHEKFRHPYRMQKECVQRTPLRDLYHLRSCQHF